MPWGGERDAYKVWLSEIILQQTRVEQGLPYYERFVTAYPTITDLAAAPSDDVMRLWEGLGYYSRARHLHATAKVVATTYKGIFPSDYADIRALKGVGDYTAAAIAAFAFDLPYPVVDGNVYRVLSRVFGIATPIDSTAGKHHFAAVAKEALGGAAAAVYNQAIMNFGAMQCVPASPNCADCPMNSFCIARHERQVTVLPVKEKKMLKRERHFNYLVLRMKGSDTTYLQKRTDNDIWQGLYQFPMLETEAIVEDEKVLRENPFFESWAESRTFAFVSRSRVYRQTLTHRFIVAQFWEIDLSEPLDDSITQNFVEVTFSELSSYAMPRILRDYLGDTSPTLF